MKTLDEKVEELVKAIDALHESIAHENWKETNRQGFVFGLETYTKKLKELYYEFADIDRELKGLLEKNVPDVSQFLSELRREITVFDSNLKMEKSTKFRENLINETEPMEVPDLYSSLQHKIMTLTLKARYSAERMRTFLHMRKTHYSKKGAAAKNLLELLNEREAEIADLKQKHHELKRKSFLGFVQEKNIAETESEFAKMDKDLNAAVLEVNNSLKIHFSQMAYVEGSFAQLKEKVGMIEAKYENFSKKALEVIKELKKERDYAKTVALDVESETLKMRGEYTKRIISMEEDKQALKEKVAEKYSKEISRLKKDLDERAQTIRKMNLLIEKQEEEIKNLRKGSK
ncbi:MAG: hypothetical protein NTZ73_00530 [Candidatus Diapherotrites archaeon]|nr:hypothetical protein [Candidatus Diapherotrites archaeon]